MQEISQVVSHQKTDAVCHLFELSVKMRKGFSVLFVTSFLPTDAAKILANLLLIKVVIFTGILASGIFAQNERGISTIWKPTLNRENYQKEARLEQWKATRRCSEKSRYKIKKTLLNDAFLPRCCWRTTRKVSNGHTCKRWRNNTRGSDERRITVS